MRNPFYHRQAITDPRHFFGRGALVRGLLEMIDSGQSCAVVGERRIGKSSLLAYLADDQVQSAHQLEAERTLATVLDFLALHTCSPTELWLEILESLELETEDPEARAILERATRSPELGFGTFRRTLRRLKRRGFRVVLLCDEFELAVQNPQFDSRFFGALRSLAGGEAVVFVTASRLSLLELGQYREEEVREKVMGSPFFNIFAEFAVGPFEDYEMAEMITGSLDPTPIRLTGGDIDFLDRLAGRHPYCLQLVAYHLFEELQRAGLGRGEVRRAPSLEAGELEARSKTCRSEVREKAGRELAKIFRNQWKHSSSAELRALAALAASEPEHPEGQVPRPGVLDGRILARLEQRGLVKEIRSPNRGASRGYRDTTQSSRRFGLFSELLREWIAQQMTLPSPEEPSSRVSTTAERRVNGGHETTLSMPRDAVETAIPERYQVLEEIGRGGAGTVFKAWDERLERLVAIKVLDRRIRDSPEHFETLLTEARACAALHHPHIVTIFDIDSEHGFLVLEFLAGGSLRDLLEMVPKLPLGDVFALAEQLGTALDAAHRAGVVHRDLKPENILLAARPPLRGSQSGRPILPPVKLADFGTALRFGDLDRLAERRAVAGTLAYMAPEQLAGKETGPTADIFSLGVVLHEARDGVHPPGLGGTGGGPSQLGGEGSNENPLDKVLHRCLRHFPFNRYPTADDFLTALRAAAGSSS